MKRFRWVCTWIAAALLLTSTAWASTVNPWLDDEAAASGNAVLTDAYQRRAVATLAGLGIISNETLFAETAQETITRLEAARLLLALSGRNETLYLRAGSAYSDVKSGAGAVGYVTAEKLMTGYTDGTFRPEDGLAYNDAVRAVVELMGYRPYVLLSGGGATDYLMVANQYALIRGLQQPEDGTAVTKLSFALCLYNLLDQKVLESYETGAFTRYRTGDTLLKRNLNIGQGKGVVEATEFGTLSNQQYVLRSAVRIDGVDYPVDALTAQQRYDITQLLGYRVYYYYTDESDPALVFAWQDESVSDSVRIEAGDIVSFSGSRLTADDPETGKREWYGVSALANVIRNGRYTGSKANAFTMETLVPETGYITLVDQDLDGEYDVVVVEAFRNVLVEEVSTTSYRLRDKFSGETIELSRQDLEQLPLITKSGRTASLSAIQPWQAIGVMTSDDGELVQIRIPSSNAVSGIVTEKDEDTVTIDGTAYRLSEDYLLSAAAEKPEFLSENITVGMSGNFILNIEGKVIAVQKDALSAARQVGYLIEAGYDSGIAQTLHVKIMSQDGELLQLESKTSFRFNGNADRTPQQVFSALCPDGKETEQQLVYYRTNGQGKLVMLATTFDAYSAGNEGVEPDEDQPMIDSYWAERTYISAHSKFEYNGRDVDPSYREFHIDKDTIVFTVPTTYDGDDSLFGVTGMSVFTDETTYQIAGYNMDETYTADFVVAVAQQGTSISANNDPIALVTGVGKAVNKQGNETVMLKLLYNGSEARYVVRDNALAYMWKYSSSAATENIALSDLRKGDIVRVALDENGEIGAIAKCLPRSKDASADTPQTTFTTNHGAYPELTYGKVVERSGVNLGVEAADGPTLPKLIFRATGATIYVYDVKSDQFYVGDVSDIYDSTHNGEDAASYVMLRVQNNTVFEVVVYNYNK